MVLNLCLLFGRQNVEDVLMVTGHFSPHLIAEACDLLLEGSNFTMIRRLLQSFHFQLASRASPPCMLRGHRPLFLIPVSHTSSEDHIISLSHFFICRFSVISGNDLWDGLQFI
jgi:hypothetical protein